MNSGGNLPSLGQFSSNEFMPANYSARQEFETTLLQRIASSERFKIYQDAFRTATGLPLRLVSADLDNWCLDDQAINRSPFCEALNLCNSARGACLETNRRLMQESEVSGPTTRHCFAGLCATAVPIKMGASVIGQVARQAGLSESHFCRLFKDSSGLTLTDYVNRCRIDWAKRELLKPEARISEIAFLVGYQSLSQFNRSFVRIVGTSPTLYRRDRLERAAS